MIDVSITVLHENDLIDLIISTQQNFLCYQANQSNVDFVSNEDVNINGWLDMDWNMR